MSVTIDKAFVKTFENNVRHLAQQSDSRLRAWVQEKGPESSSHSFKLVAAQSLSAKSSRRSATPESDTVWSNRVAIPATYDGGDSVETEDEVQMLINPTAELSKSFAMAANRQFDDLIINAADGAALDEAANSNSFPAGQYYSGSSAYADEIDMKAVTAIGEIFNENDVDPAMEKVAVVGPKQVRKLLHEAKATSSDYVGGLYALLNGGFLQNWLGFTWIMSNRLLKPSTNQIKCIFMTKRAMGLLVTEDTKTFIAQDPSTSFLWRVYAKISAGAVRVEDKHIVVAKLADTVTIS